MGAVPVGRLLFHAEVVGEVERGVIGETVEVRVEDFVFAIEDLCAEEYLAVVAVGEEVLKVLVSEGGVGDLLVERLNFKLPSLIHFNVGVD